MADLRKAAARGTSVMMAAQGVRFVLQMTSLVILSRLLTPAEVGLVAMVTSVIGVAEIVRDFGLSSAAIQAATLEKAERDNLFWINTTIGTACALVTAALAPLLAALYGEPQVTAIVLALAWLFVVSGANTQYRAMLSRDLRFGALAVTDIGAQVASIIVAVSLAATGAGYWAIVAQQITFITVSAISNAVQGRWVPGRPRRDVPMRRFFGYGGSVFGTQAMGYALNNVDNIGIGAVWGSGPLGLYSRGYQLLMVPLAQITAPLSKVVLPVLSRVQDETDLLERYARRFHLMICYTLCLGFGVAAGLAVPIVAILFGPDWSGVAPIFVVLAVGGIFKAMDQNSYLIYLAKGLTTELFKLYLWTRPLMLLAILAGLPWGPVGVATGHLVAAVGHWLFSASQVSRLAGIDPRPRMVQSIRCLGAVTAPAGLAAYGGTLLVDGRWAELGLGVTLALAWILLVAAFVPAVREDVDVLLRAAPLPAKLTAVALNRPALRRPVRRRPLPHRPPPRRPLRRRPARCSGGRAGRGYRGKHRA